MQDNLLNNFSSNYKQVLINSINLAWQLNQKKVGPDLILYNLFFQKSSIASEILKKNKINEQKIKKLIKPAEQSNKKNKPTPVFGANTISLIEKSAAIAFRHKHNYIATEHLLLALVESNNKQTKKLLTDLNLNTKQIEQQIIIIFNSASKFNDFSASIDLPAENQPEELLDLSPAMPGSAPKSFLKNFTFDLTDNKNQKNLDPVIGRENEIERLIEILMRRTKNNPLILGDPGVGKTAIVEGLAKKINNQQVPEVLANKRILSLDIPLIVAGTMFRGEFENRLKQLIEEIKKDQDIIIFIDEIHNIIGAGSSNGSMDVANILKPALAKGQIRCIGATTFEEYKKHFENDAALERRFQLIKLNEPTQKQTIKILQGIKDNYQQYHQVKISDQAVKYSVELADRYLTERFFPDKAIDLLDEAAARVRINQKTNPVLNHLNTLIDQHNQLKRQKQEAVLRENFNDAIILKKKEQQVQEQIDLLEQKIKNQKKAKPQINKNDICQIVAKITNIPAAELQMDQNQKFINLETLLQKKVIGQEKAIKALAQAIRRSKAGINETNKPLGSFIFIGSSGTGKTYTAKILSQILFQNQNSLIKIDMSEFSEKFNISKLIGAPAGYVGYKESGKLTDAVKRNSNSVVLFDEIEKAHPDVFNLLLQILDEGYITDAAGKKINFKNTIIIMTSNLGSEKINNSIGFDKNNQITDLNLESEIKKFFRPEFINRLDKIIYFNNLNHKNLQQIAQLELDKLAKRLEQQKIELQIKPAVMKYLVNQNQQSAKGARYIKQNIEELITNPLAEKILDSKKKDYIINFKKQIIIK